MTFVQVTDSYGNKWAQVGAKNLGWKHNTAYGSANADVFAGPLTPTPPTKLIIATIFTGTSPHLSIKRTNAANTVTHDVTLTTGVNTETTVWTNPGDTFQIQYTVTGTINYLSVNEVFGAS
jgi:hypothetical protein